MTPEGARELYNEARLQAMTEYSDASKAVRQNEADLKAWKVVIDAVRKENHRPSEK